MIRQIATAEDGVALEIIQTADGASLREDGDQAGAKHYPSLRAAREAARANLNARLSEARSAEAGVPVNVTLSTIVWRTE